MLSVSPMSSEVSCHVSVPAINEIGIRTRGFRVIGEAKKGEGRVHW